MIGIKVDVSHLRTALHNHMQRIGDEAWKAMGDALYAAEEAGKLAVEGQTKTRTGRLLKSFQRTQLSNLGGRVSNTAPYARWVNDGTPEHLIMARNARFLRFEMDGAIHYRRAVMHPGTKPRPFLPQIRAVGTAVLHASLQRRIDDASRAFGK